MPRSAVFTAAPVATSEVILRPPALAYVWVGVGRRHETVAVPAVRLAAGEVLVALEMSTVCGSDEHTVLGHRAALTPLVLGHEYVGRVIAIGAGGARAADGPPLGLGDRIVWSVTASCGTCDRCVKGLTQKCRSLRKYGHERIAARWELTGGFATHVHLLAGTAIVKVGEVLDARVAAPLACGTATAWAAVQRADVITPVDGSVVLVLGAGLVGLTTAAIAADRGARVIVADLDADRRALAHRFGAHASYDPTDPAAERAAYELLRVDAPDIVIEASGANPAVARAISTVAVGGVVVLVGSVFPGPAVPLAPEEIVRKLVTIRGLHNYAPADLVGARDFLRRAATAHPFAELVSEVFPLSKIDEAIAASPRAVRVGVIPAPGV